MMDPMTESSEARGPGKVCPICRCKRLRWHQVHGMMLLHEVDGKMVYMAVCSKCGQQFFSKGEATLLSDAPLSMEV